MYIDNNILGSSMAFYSLQNIFIHFIWYQKYFWDKKCGCYCIYLTNKETKNQENFHGLGSITSISSTKITQAFWASNLF